MILIMGVAKNNFYLKVSRIRQQKKNENAALKSHFNAASLVSPKTMNTTVEI